MTGAVATEREVQAGPAVPPRHRRLEAERLVPAEPAGRALGVLGDLQRRVVLGDQPLDPRLLAVGLLDVEVDALDEDFFGSLFDTMYAPRAMPSAAMPMCSWCQCSGLAFATPCFCTARQSAALIDLISMTCSAFGASRKPTPTASILPRSQPPASAKRSCSRRDLDSGATEIGDHAVLLEVAALEDRAAGDRWASPAATPSGASSQSCRSHGEPSAEAPTP